MAGREATLSNIKIKDIGFGFEHNESPAEKQSWRIRMEQLMNQLKNEDIGLLITVDQVLPDPEDMIELVSEYQLLQRSGCKIALLMAGLPKYVDELLNDKSVSFLPSARRDMIGRVSDDEVSAAIANTMISGGKTISGEPLQKAVSAADGFPYMIQLVGYYIFEEAEDQKDITLDTAEAGIAQAADEFTNGVLFNTFADLSEKDKAFLYAMLEDEDSSRLTDIATRLNKSNGYAYTYKKRLEHAGAIDERNKRLRFALPYFRTYVQEQMEYE